MRSVIVAFVCGFAYEAACAYWVRYAEQRKPWHASAWSCFAALVTVIGLGEALHRPLPIVAYVIGYGCGTFAVVRKREP